MARLIDANAVIEKMHLDMCMDCIGGIKGGCHNCDYEHAMNVIEDAPTVDAVEVVRCKDCKYYKKFKGFRGAWCHRWLRKNFEFMPKPNDFCSFGKRKESE